MEERLKNLDARTMAIEQIFATLRSAAVSRGMSAAKPA
jgi:hypothetical protein